MPREKRKRVKRIVRKLMGRVRSLKWPVMIIVVGVMRRRWEVMMGNISVY